MGVLLPRVPPPNASASSLTLLISIFHQVLWHISNFHLGKIITQQREAHKKLNPQLGARTLAALCRYWRVDNVLCACVHHCLCVALTHVLYNCVIMLLWLLKLSEVGIHFASLYFLFIGSAVYLVLLEEMQNNKIGDLSFNFNSM